MSGLGQSENKHSGQSCLGCMNWATELGAGIYFTIFAIPTRIAQSSKIDDSWETIRLETKADSNNGQILKDYENKPKVCP